MRYRWQWDHANFYHNRCSIHHEHLLFLLSIVNVGSLTPICGERIFTKDFSHCENQMQPIREDLASDNSSGQEEWLKHSRKELNSDDGNVTASAEKFKKSHHATHISASHTLHIVRHQDIKIFPGILSTTQLNYLVTDPATRGAVRYRWATKSWPHPWLSDGSVTCAD